jgi:thiosulfate reductase cytochrome b subunit
MDVPAGWPVAGIIEMTMSDEKDKTQPLPPRSDEAAARPSQEAGAAEPAGDAALVGTAEQAGMAGVPAAVEEVAVVEAPAAAEAPVAAEVVAEAPVVAAAPAMPASARAAGKRPLVKRHHWLVRVAHWANAVLLVGMIGSGLQIYGAYRYFGPRGGPFYPNPWTGKVFPHWATLGGWLAPGLNWHFFLAWPFVVTGAAYLGYLVFSGEWRSLLFQPRDVPRAVQMQLYYLRLRKEHPPQGKHNALQKAAYSFILLLGVLSVATGFAIYKPDQLAWLTRLFGGYELARYWHFCAVFVFLAFTLVHVSLVLLVDPASLRAMITGWYRGRFPSHD